MFISIYISYLKYYIWFGVIFSWLGLVFYSCVFSYNPHSLFEMFKSTRGAAQPKMRRRQIKILIASYISIDTFLVKLYGLQAITII